jgi:hypothetical protein
MVIEGKRDPFVFQSTILKTNKNKKKNLFELIYDFKQDNSTSTYAAAVNNIKKINGTT